MYGIFNIHRNEFVTGGFSREEALAYIECEGQPGDSIIYKTDGGWNFTESGRPAPVKEDV